MEVATKRPPEKVMLLHEPGTASSVPPSHRPPVKLPPKPAAFAESPPAASGWQLPSSIVSILPTAVPPPPPPAGGGPPPLADGGQSPSADDAAAFDLLPPPPPDTELLLLADAIKKEEPAISTATAAAVAIERIASKYDTSANATRTWQVQQQHSSAAAPSGAAFSVEPSNDGAVSPWQQQRSEPAAADAAAGSSGSGGGIRAARAAVERLLSSRVPSFAPLAVVKSEARGGLLPATAAAAPLSTSEAATPAALDASEPLPTPPPPSSFAGGGASSSVLAGETDGCDQRSRTSSVDSLQSGSVVVIGGGSSETSSAVGSPQLLLPLVRSDSPRSPKVGAAVGTTMLPSSVGSSHSGGTPPPVARGNDESEEDGGSALPVVPTETVAVKLTRLKIENKRNKAVPRHDHVGDSKKVSFLVAEKPGAAGGERWPSSAMAATSAPPPMDERRLRTGLSADDVSQAEAFYRSHKTEVRTCQCMATLFFADSSGANTGAPSGGDSPAAASVSVDDWKPTHIGIPVLVYDSGEGKRQRALSFVFAERGTGFQLWRNMMHWQTDYRAVEPTFHQMRAGPPLATGSGRKFSKSGDAGAMASSSMAGVAFQDGECAEQFMAHYRQLVEWHPDDNILGDPSLKKKKKTKKTSAAASADKPKRLQPLPSKSAISQPVEFAHITQLKRSEDGVVLPTVQPSSAHKADSLTPGKAIS